MSLYLLVCLFVIGQLALAGETCNIVARLREEPLANGTTATVKKNYNNVELFWRFDVMPSHNPSVKWCLYYTVFLFQ